MKKISIYILSLAGMLFALPAKAACPVCIVAVASGVGLSRWLGIDDTISGLWIGGLTMAMVIWTINWLTKKNIRFIGRKPLVLILYYVMVVWPLHRTEVLWHPLNKIWGMDKVMLGIAVGSVLFLAGHLVHLYLKKKNGGRSHFPLQATAIPIIPLIVFSFVFYLLTR